MLKLLTVAASLIFSFCSAVGAAEADQNACQGDPDRWRQLLNSTDLSGWKHVGLGEMTVEDGLIRTHGGMGLLYWTGGKIGNCVLRVVFRMGDENDNSGVFIRIPLEPREEWMPVHYRIRGADRQPSRTG